MTLNENQEIPHFSGIHDFWTLEWLILKLKWAMARLSNTLQSEPICKNKQQTYSVFNSYFMTNQQKTNI